MVVSHATYEAVALEDSDTTWEYVCGRLRAKPGMTQEHNDVAVLLTFRLQSQLDWKTHRVRSNAGRLRAGAGNEYVPDVMVVPAEASLAQRGNLKLETFPNAVLFVAEVWSKSTGEYDVDTKIPDYLARGDAVVWRVHPYERSLTAWTRRPDGGYDEARHNSGTVAIASLPGVSIELESLFE
jgi:Uma2 family endonuclease